MILSAYNSLLLKKNITQRMTWTQLYNLSHEEFLDRACVVGRAASWWRRQWIRSRRTNIEWRRRRRELAASWKLHELRIYSNHRHTIAYHSTLALCSFNYICAIYRRRNSPLWWCLYEVSSLKTYRTKHEAVRFGRQSRVTTTYHIRDESSADTSSDDQ